MFFEKVQVISFPLSLRLIPMNRYTTSFLADATSFSLLIAVIHLISIFSHNTFGIELDGILLCTLKKYNPYIDVVW